MLKKYRVEFITLAVFIALATAVSYFHEPWFDEAQAWEIARCASIKEMFTNVSHYEGHPQLWWLILAPFAKNGAPFELTIKVISITFSSAATAVLLFKSPFPKVVRCLLPFTFFIFYMYTVMSRPYCVMYLAFTLLACTYKNRNEKPFPYVLSMALLCATHAYGIIFSGMLSVVWLIEIITEHKKSGAFKKLFTDKRCWILLCLAVFACGLICTIIPAEDVYYDGATGSWINRLRNAVNTLLIPGEAFLVSYYDRESIAMTKTSMIITMVVGTIILLAMSMIMRKNKKLLTFLLPWLTVTIFGQMSFFAPHHCGLTTLYFMFMLWIILDEKGKIEIPAFLIKAYERITSIPLKKALKCVGTIAAAVPIAWTAFSIYYEIRYPYGPTETADFIKENNLQDKNIMVMWASASSNQTGVSFGYTPPSDDEETIEYTNLCGLAPTTLAYFDSNIFSNFNIDDPEDMYQHYQITEDADSVFAKWHEQGLPEVLISICDLEKVFSEDELEGVSYVQVKVIETNYIWKFARTQSEYGIYLRSDLLDDYPNLQRVEDSIDITFD